MSRHVIAPCIWLDDEADDAAALYTNVLPEARVVARSYLPNDLENPAGKPPGSLLTVELEAGGRRLTLLNGGSEFRPDQTVSLFVILPTDEEVDRVANALGEGGDFPMALGEYPWSPRYAWVRDRFGVSWQVMRADPERDAQDVIFPCLMFNGEVHGRAEEALRFYAAELPGGKVESLTHYGDEHGEAAEGTLVHGRIRVGEGLLAAMDSHIDHGARFSEGLSLQVFCETDAEVDRLWDELSEGGATSQCGWLTDRFGVSWQIIPPGFKEIMERAGTEREAFDRAFAAMLTMTKLDGPTLRKAFEGA